MLTYEENAHLTVDVVHAKIMGRAQQLANKAYADYTGVSEIPSQYRAGERFKNPPNKRRRLSSSGNIFMYDAAQTKSGGLTLAFNEILWTQLDAEERMRARDIAAQSVEEALMEYKREWIVGVLHDALQGTNYFDRFVKAGGQMSLF